MRVAVAVQGRFHAFDLANGLLELNTDARLFTNYPARVVSRFGFDASRVRSFVTHGIASRLAGRAGGHTAEPLLHTVFGHWVAHELGGTDWASVNIWSSVATEWLDLPESSHAPVVVHRSSSHIRVQRRLLDEEERRVGIPLDKPTDWMIDREEGEYERATLVVVPSAFAAASFAEKQLPPTNVACIPLASYEMGFHATEDVVARRLARIRAGEPLRLLYVGTLSYQKGMFDLEAIIGAAARNRFDFRLVGPVRPECEELAGRLRQRVDVRPAVSREELIPHYEWADLLLLPTIQDGFSIVLTQAAAAGVPFIASTNSGGPDLLALGLGGWVLPPREPERWLAQLQAIDGDRASLSATVAQAAQHVFTRSWKVVADELIKATERSRALLRPRT